MKMEYEIVNPLELSLDFDNPRFLKKLSDEAEMRRYLIEFEDSLSVARSIADYGMLPGDMVICVIEGDKTIVVEGNRRVSIMQMMLDRDLIPEGYHEFVPEVSDEILGEIRALNIQIIENRDLALTVMANRHITGIKQWKPLAKKKFFASRFDEGMTVDQLSFSTNITRGEIEKDITEYKFFVRNYNKYAEDNPSFNKDIIDLKIDRFIRVFGTKMNSDGEARLAKDYLMMARNENMEYVSQLPEDIFTGFTQHVFEKAFDREGNDSVNTRSSFDDIPGIEEWKSKINECRDNLPIPIGDLAPSAGIPVSDVTAPGVPTSREPEPSGGPSAPKFMGSLTWRNRLSGSNQDHVPMMRALKELYDMSSGQGKGYVKYPIAAAMLMRSAYEQGLKLLIKTAGLWENFESKHSNPRNQTLSVMENYVETNANSIMDKGTPLRKTFGNICRGNYRPFLNDCTHDLDFAYPTKDKLEAFAGEGMAGFLQCVIDRAAENAER
jgi:hypothetical protein